MRRGKNIIIVKRDGGLEPFRSDKLERCLARLLEACQHDPGLAGPMAEAVTIHFRNWNQAHPPSSEYIYECVRMVLAETGFADAAARLEEGRRQRHAPCQPRVFDPRGSADATTRWRPEKLLTTLQERYGLRRATAEILAAEVELRVLRLGYRLISKNFLEELVRTELAAWGLLDDTAVNGRERSETTNSNKLQPQRET